MHGMPDAVASVSNCDTSMDRVSMLPATMMSAYVCVRNKVTQLSDHREPCSASNAHLAPRSHGVAHLRLCSAVMNHFNTLPFDSCRFLTAAADIMGPVPWRGRDM